MSAHMSSFEPSENGAKTPAKRRRGTRGGRGRKRKPAVAGAEDAAAIATAESGEGEDADAEHELSENGAPEIIADTDNGAGEDDASSNEPEGDWTYTPMSEWGSLDADEK